MDTLYFTWLDNPVDIEKNLEMPQFSLQGHYKKDCSQNYTAGNIWNNFSVISIKSNN